MSLLETNKIINATGTTHKSAIANLQSNTSIPIETIHSERIEPSNCGIACEKTCSKSVQSFMIVAVRSARSLFSKKDNADKTILDTASKILKNEYLKYGFKPEYISLDLEHQFDEFHGYDHFEKELDEHALRITDIWAFLTRVLNG